jgi:hypothetical protein
MFNLLTSIPPTDKEEIVHNLLSAGSVRIERILRPAGKRMGRTAARCGEAEHQGRNSRIEKGRLGEFAKTLPSPHRMDDTPRSHDLVGSVL